jgi:hypothetical protein
MTELSENAGFALELGSERRTGRHGTLENFERHHSTERLIDR